MLVVRTPSNDRRAFDEHFHEVNAGLEAERIQEEVTQRLPICRDLDLVDDEAVGAGIFVQVFVDAGRTETHRFRPNSQVAFDRCFLESRLDVNALRIDGAIWTKLVNESAKAARGSAVADRQTLNANMPVRIRSRMIAQSPAGFRGGHILARSPVGFE